MNEIYIHGRLGKDPEIVEKNGKNGPFKAAKLSIASDRDFGDETDWFPCEVNGKSADVIERYFHKGKPILIRGEMQSYTSERDNSKHWKCVVRKFWFEKGTSAEREDGPDPKKENFEDLNEDVPF